MQTVKIKRVELLQKVQENLEKHNKILADARDGYRRIVQEVLESVLNAVKEGKTIDLAPIKSIDEPQDQSESYKTAIEMLRMGAEDLVELSQSEFKQYVLNKWSWRASFLGTNMKYSASSLNVDENF